jgi:hypothetical protein
MYSDNGYVAIMFVPQFINPSVIATENTCPLLPVYGRITSRFGKLIYTRGQYGPRNLQHVSILKCCKLKQDVSGPMYLHFLLVNGCKTYPQFYERQY